MEWNFPQAGSERDDECAKWECQRILNWYFVFHLHLVALASNLRSFSPDQFYSYSAENPKITRVSLALAHVVSPKPYHYAKVGVGGWLQEDNGARGQGCMGRGDKIVKSSCSET